MVWGSFMWDLKPSVSAHEAVARLLALAASSFASAFYHCFYCGITNGSSRSTGRILLYTSTPKVNSSKVLNQEKR